MDQTETIHTCGTPHDTVNTSSRNSSYNSVDSVESGYLSLTPNSGANSSIVSGHRSKIPCVSKRHHRTRLDPLQSERGQRHRSKLNQMLLNTSDYSVSESSNTESLIQKSLNTIDNRPSVSLGHCSLNSSQSLEFNDDSIHRSRILRNCRTTIAISPATLSPILQFLSSPLSPAVPSSSFIASEPIEEDVEMKLVIVPQSTPQTELTNSPRRETPALLPRDVVSPSCKSINYSSDSHKLSKLFITDIAKIKPKRLDFGHRTHARATPDYTGKETVDILALLGDKSNHFSTVSKILSYLSPLDLCSVSMVSKTWRKICTNDIKANTRRLIHVIMRQNVKENLELIKKSKIEEDIPSSPKTRYAKRGYLLQVQNLQVKGKNLCPPGSPPVSPSKAKFHSFVKAGRTLGPTDRLRPCPKCSFACHVDRKKNVGICSRQICGFEFCILCETEPHPDLCKKQPPLLATPTKRNKRRPVIGSRQSRRNLRRL